MRITPEKQMEKLKKYQHKQVWFLEIHKTDKVPARLRRKGGKLKMTSSRIYDQYL
jgi:hypothetical protein